MKGLRKKEIVILFFLSAVQFLHIVDFMIIMPLGPQFREHFSLQPDEFIYLVVSYTLSAGLVGVFSGLFLDRFDRKKALLFCFAGLLAGTLACGLTHSFLILIISRSVAGAFGGMVGATVMSIVADQFPEERRGAAMGVVMTSFSLAAVIGVPLGLYLTSLYNWQTPFLSVAGVGLPLLLLMAYFVPPMRGHLLSKQDRPLPLKVAATIFSNPNQLLALLFMVLIMFGQFSVIPLISDYLVHNHGFNEHQIMMVYFTGGVATMVSLPLIGRLADRWGKPRTYTLFAVLSAIPLLLVTDLPDHWPIFLAYVVSMLFFVFISGRSVPATTMVTSTALPQNRGALMSFVISVRQLAAALAAFVTGLIVTEDPATHAIVHFELVGYIAVLATLLSIFIAVRLKVVDAGVVVD